MDALIANDKLLLVLAGSILILVLIVVAIGHIRRSAWAQLRRKLRALARARAAADKAQRAADKARQRAQTLHENADRVAPKRLVEAREHFEDLSTLAKHATEKASVAENHVRLVILNDYAPRKQARLLRKHLPDSDPDTRPFRF